MIIKATSLNLDLPVHACMFTFKINTRGRHDTLIMKHKMQDR